jgi:hypothetical protein
MKRGERPATVTTEWLVVSDLRIDRAYQRDITKGRVAEIIHGFDPDLLGTFLVSRRASGTEYLLDGQTRQAALVEMGWADQRVPCLVYGGLTRADEARIFVGANVTRTKPSAVAIFKGKLAAGDPDTIEIHSIAIKHGYLTDISKTSFKAGTITSPTALVAIHHHGGPDLLDTTLAVTSAAWPGQHVNAPCLKALGIFLAQYGPALSMERLVQVLSKTTPDVIVSRAQMLTTATRSAAPIVQVLVGDYNNRLKSGRLIFTEVRDRDTWRQRSAMMFVGESASA